MLPLDSIMMFSLVSLILVLSPGPNMMYLLSRTLSQGQDAGFISYAGIATTSVIYLSFAALGLTSILFASPYAYDVLRWAGVIYLAYLAWCAAFKRPTQGAVGIQNLPKDGPARLYVMGLLTNLLNPKQGLFYLAVLPQFIQVQRGDTLLQYIQLGVIQISISFVVNGLLIVIATRLNQRLSINPSWIRAQRYLMATVLAVLAARLAFQSRP